MPTVWAGERRGQLVTLVVLGLLEAVLAVLLSLQVEALLTPPRDTDWWDIASVVGFIGGILASRWLERVVAEALGQGYVYEQRHRLLMSAIGSVEYSGSLGVTVTRASNDLSAVRNWIALGIVPLLTGAPLILVILGALFALDLQIGMAVSIPLAVVLLLIPLLSRLTLQRARELRRQRGRMSARIADTVMAGESVRASGAVQREINALDRHSQRVADAAVDRAWVSGFTRSLTATATSACTIAVVLVSVLGYTDTASVASTMLLLGILTTPLTDLGRVVEYRQNFRAAARTLAPVLTDADEFKREERRRAKGWTGMSGNGEVEIKGLQVAGRLLPDLHAIPGDRVLLTATDPHQLRATVATLASLFEEDVVHVDGADLGQAPGKYRRELFGVASEAVPIERGSVHRLASFRAPGASEDEIKGVLDIVGLKPVLDADEKGLARQLKNDGQPWTTSQVMQLKVARAILRDPPLLVLEGVDNILDDDSVELLREHLMYFPGVVLMVTPKPERLVGSWQEWDVDGVEVAYDPQAGKEGLDEDE
ncbi:ABC transporter transmembrane domain-containing protein [Corynebacterium uterequi]|nr:ABC transporter ATP-binding protein [Corynebacterium uterequi]